MGINPCARNDLTACSSEWRDQKGASGSATVAVGPRPGVEIASWTHSGGEECFNKWLIKTILLYSNLVHRLTSTANVRSCKKARLAKQEKARWESMMDSLWVYDGHETV